jgi:hypothetical protein
MNNIKDCAKLFLVEYSNIEILSSYDPNECIRQIDKIFVKYTSKND